MLGGKAMFNIFNLGQNEPDLLMTYPYKKDRTENNRNWIWKHL